MTVEDDAKKMTQGLIDILKPYENDCKTHKEWMELLQTPEFEKKFTTKMHEVLDEKV